MDLEKINKKIDYTKTNIGLEIECLIVSVDELETAGVSESQKVFSTLINKYGWKTRKASPKKEIHSVDKEIEGRTVKIMLDVTYSIFEITTLEPVENLETLEKIQKEYLLELREVLKENNLMIWPFGVAPASTFLLKTTKPTKENILDDDFYKPVNKIDYLARLCHITSHQVNIDIPLEKMLPAINAFYKNLGTIIEKFANSAVYTNGMLYKEGRYYWWLDSFPNLRRWRIPTFPEKEFSSWSEFYGWIFEGLGMVVRNNMPMAFKGGSVYEKGELANIKKILKEKNFTGIDPEGKEMPVSLEKADIEFLLKQSWIDFKPHFDFDQSYTLEEFLKYYEENNLDGFFQKYCKHCWLEIRPCSPHFEENAMVIPRYFYNIVKNIDQYIAEAKKISWEDARISRDKAIGYIK
jgi:hypothetical protein